MAPPRLLEMYYVRSTTYTYPRSFFFPTMRNSLSDRTAHFRRQTKYPPPPLFVWVCGWVKIPSHIEGGDLRRPASPIPSAFPLPPPSPLFPPPCHDCPFIFPSTMGVLTPPLPPERDGRQWGQACADRETMRMPRPQVAKECYLFLIRILYVVGSKWY